MNNECVSALFFILHRAIPVPSVVGYARQKESSLLRTLKGGFCGRERTGVSRIWCKQIADGVKWKIFSYMFVLSIQEGGRKGDENSKTIIMLHSDVPDHYRVMPFNCRGGDH